MNRRAFFGVVGAALVSSQCPAPVPRGGALTLERLRLGASRVQISGADIAASRYQSGQFADAIAAEQLRIAQAVERELLLRAAFPVLTVRA